MPVARGQRPERSVSTRHPRKAALKFGSKKHFYGRKCFLRFTAPPLTCENWLVYLYMAHHSTGLSAAPRSCASGAGPSSTNATDFRKGQRNRCGQVSPRRARNGRAVTRASASGTEWHYATPDAWTNISRTVAPCYIGGTRVITIAWWTSRRRKSCSTYC